MKLPPSNNRAEIARRAGINPQYLYQCLTGRRAMDAAKARLVEVVSDGEITRRQLRALDWHLIWPELVTDEHPAPVEKDDMTLG